MKNSSTPAGLKCKKDVSPQPGAEADLLSSSRPDIISIKLIVVLLVFSFALFANTINQYFLLDDFEVLFSAKYNKLAGVLLGHDTVLEHKFFRPLPMFFTWVLYKLFGNTPPPYHILSIFLHAATAIAGANLVYLLHRNTRVAALFGILFVAFPNHAEVVNWPAITFTSWAALCCLLSLNLFAYFRLSGKYYLLILSLVFFLGGMLSKEDAFTLPAIMVIFDLYFSRVRKLEYPLPRQAGIYAVYGALLLIVILLTRVRMKLGAGYLTVEGEDLVSLYLSNVFALISDLIRMEARAWKYLVAPVSPEIPFSSYLISLVWLLALVSLGVLLWKRKIQFSSLLFSFLFISITTLPILGTFRVLALTHWIRFLYLPSVGGCYILSLILHGIDETTRRPVVRFTMIAAALAPVIILTKYYDHQWIEAQQENKGVVERVAVKLGTLPQFSRVYVEGLPWSQKEIPRIDYSFPGAAGLYFDREYLQGALFFLPANKVLALEREEYDDQQPWRYFHMAWEGDTKQATDPREITPHAHKKFVDEWDFSGIHRQFLGPVNGLIPVQTKSGSLPLFMVDGPWTLLWLSPVNPVRPVQYVTLEMMLSGKRGGMDICRLFWISEDDREISGGKSIGFFAEADGKFHTYKIPLYKNGLTLTHPRMVRLAVRPSQQVGSVFCIKKITVESY
ncbi:MAG: hypothetical protein C4520_09770 [Candidatus Abyssobacteria bacterium SURF_5]|uniref:Glycosyltransferase RgtA/B/C/D-like domain-containing protein n=1 Tax=Abyssobacteria bacterium (strain SURF_5) TaxID=2093360 RepID=A0A3A4NQJ0_ABYX5|nr:MAG: hypothetical protein C4520_09770 [Candidatus Abyssubacteria bacterium SURF_5]